MMELTEYLLSHMLASFVPMTFSEQLKMLIKDATVARKCLNGIVCLYKYSPFCGKMFRKTFREKMITDLNDMKCREPKKYVHISGNTTEPLHIEVQPNYADHPLVVGPRYIPQELKCFLVKYISPYVSGVHLMGVDEDGVRQARELQAYNLLSTYRIIAELGKKTDNQWAHGQVTYKYKYEYIEKHGIDKAAASIQATSQKQLIASCGYHPHSQEAYEAISSGLLRPANDKLPICYSIKCIDLNPPYFTLELVTINENVEFFLSIVSEIGHRLKNMAVTVSIRCIRTGFFSVEDALLKKHWQLQYVLDNIKHCREKMEKNDSYSTYLKKIKNERKSEEIQLITENVDDMEEENVLDDELLQEN